MAFVHHEILSFLTKFTELTSHGFSANLQLNSFKGKVFINLRTELDTMFSPQQHQPPLPPQAKNKSQARRRKRREHEREANKKEGKTLIVEDAQNGVDGKNDSACDDVIPSYVVNNSNIDSMIFLPNLSGTSNLSAAVDIPSSANTPYPKPVTLDLHPLEKAQATTLMNISLSDLQDIERNFNNSRLVFQPSSQRSRDEDMEKFKNHLNTTLQM